MIGNDVRTEESDNELMILEDDERLKRGEKWWGVGEKKDIVYPQVLSLYTSRQGYDRASKIPTETFLSSDRCARGPAIIHCEVFFRAAGADKKTTHLPGLKAVRRRVPASVEVGS